MRSVSGVLPLGEPPPGVPLLTAEGRAILGGQAYDAFRGANETSAVWLSASNRVVYLTLAPLFRVFNVSDHRHGLRFSRRLFLHRRPGSATVFSALIRTDREVWVTF